MTVLPLVRFSLRLHAYEGGHYAPDIQLCCGSATLPEEVLRQAADEMLDYAGTGMSVMEMSHRSKPFEKIIGEAEQDLRDLMGIPDDYAVLFCRVARGRSLPWRL